MPVSELLSHVTLSLEPAKVSASRGAREGHRFVLLSLGGAAAVGEVKLCVFVGKIYGIN